MTECPAWQPRYRVRRIGPTAGGVPWDRAEALREFRFPWEERPTPKTEFRALWDGEHLFFRFDCEDSDLVLGDGADAREKVMGSDRAELFFARDLTLDPYYALEVDPRGEVLAYEARYYRRMNWAWTFRGLQVRGEITGGGYCVEGSIPLATLRELGVLRPGEGTMMAGVFRAEFSRRGEGICQGWMSWVDPGTGKPDFHVPAAFGLFELVERTRGGG